MNAYFLIHSFLRYDVCLHSEIHRSRFEWIRAYGCVTGCVKIYAAIALSSRR